MDFKEIFDHLDKSSKDGFVYEPEYKKALESLSILNKDIDLKMEDF
jgi:hypothetical protein